LPRETREKSERVRERQSKQALIILIVIINKSSLHRGEREREERVVVACFIKSKIENSSESHCRSKREDGNKCFSALIKCATRALTHSKNKDESQERLPAALASPVHAAADCRSEPRKSWEWERERE
jgi:hypothetical protein